MRQITLTTYLANKADTDIYLLFMGQVIRDRFPEMGVTYEFIHRGQEPFPADFGKTLQALIQQMAELIVEDDTLAYIHVKHPYLRADFLSWWQALRFDPSQVHVTQNGDQLQLTIHGPWAEAIYWETPLLALISGLYNTFAQENGERSPQAQWLEKFAKQATELASVSKEQHIPLKVAEFGTRRRFGLKEHQQILETLQRELGASFTGTSNIHFAQQLHMMPVGTIAHQFIMGMAAQFGLEEANLQTLRIWQEAYQPALQTALTDTYTHKFFFRQFGEHLDKFESYRVFRHDSGDPHAYIRHVTKFLQDHQQDTQNYTILFSDALHVADLLTLANECQKNQLHAAFGVGNSFSHAATGVPALDIVIKPSYFHLADGQIVPVAKLADDAKKTSGPAATATASALQKLGVI